MRLFIAIEISQTTRSAIASLLKELRVMAPQVKWVRAENLHVTLKFLGDTELAKLGPLQNVLSAVSSAGPVNLEFRGLGFFPNDKRPRVFWAGIQASPNLKALAADIDQTVHRLGFPLEQHPFTPHLTLARLQPPSVPQKLLQAIQEKSAQSFGSLRTGEFHLIESKLKSTGAEYTTLQTFRFATEV